MQPPRFQFLPYGLFVFPHLTWLWDWELTKLGAVESDNRQSHLGSVTVFPLIWFCKASVVLVHWRYFKMYPAQISLSVSQGFWGLLGKDKKRYCKLGSVIIFTALIHELKSLNQKDDLNHLTFLECCDLTIREALAPPYTTYPRGNG